jgi:hypothetical protein
VRTYDHYVRSHVKFVTLRPGVFPRLGRNPGPHIHVSKPNGGDVRLATRQAVFDPLHEDWVKAARLVMRITRDAREAGPFLSSLPQHTIFTAGFRRPIKNRRILGNERGGLLSAHPSSSRHPLRDGLNSLSEQLQQKGLTAKAVRASCRACRRMDRFSCRYLFLSDISDGLLKLGNLRQCLNAPRLDCDTCILYT